MEQTIYETNCRSIPAMMREAADGIEGDTDEHDRTKSMIAIQVGESGDVLVYGWGDTDDIQALGALQMGIHELLANRYGGEE